MTDNRTTKPATRIEYWLELVLPEPDPPGESLRPYKGSRPRLETEFSTREAAERASEQFEAAGVLASIARVRLGTCPACDGCGYENVLGMVGKCEWCHGRGSIPRYLGYVR